MAYAQDTLTSANAANDFVTVLDGLLLSSGWVVVENLNPSGNALTRVYQSSAAANQAGYDWYLAVCWVSLGTERYTEVWAGESYNATTHALTGIVGAPMAQQSLSGNQVVGQPTTGYTSQTILDLSTHVTSTTQKSAISFQRTTSSTTVSPGFQTILPSSAFGYWMSVTPDHVALWTTVSVNDQNAVYSTLALDSGYAASALYDHAPLICIDDLNFSLSSHFIGVPVSTSPQTYLAAHASFSGAFGAQLPNLTDNYFDAYAWAPHVYLDYMQQGSANPFPNTQIIGMVHVGHTPDILFVYGGAVGDTVEVDSATYVLTPRLTSSSPTAQTTVALLVE